MSMRRLMIAYRIWRHMHYPWRQAWTSARRQA